MVLISSKGKRRLCSLDIFYIFLLRPSFDISAWLWRERRKRERATDQPYGGELPQAFAQHAETKSQPRVAAASPALEMLQYRKSP